MDYDTYSANDAIGRVYLDLNPLLSKYGPSQIAGWLPIYDTMHGKNLFFHFSQVSFMWDMIFRNSWRIERCCQNRFIHGY